jgi:Protein of unknown function (DUF2721)
MDSSTANPFAALTLIVAPAILTNACSILTFVTSNRYAVIVDRWRAVTTDLVDLPQTAPERPMRVAHIARLEHRCKLLLMGLRGLFVAIGMFALAALVALIGASLTIYQLSAAASIAEGVGLAGGVVAVVSLLFALSRLFVEAMLSAAHVTEEAMILRQRNTPTAI